LLGGVFSYAVSGSEEIPLFPWASSAADPPMDCGGVRTIFLAERGGEVPLFWCDQNGVAGDKCREEHHQLPGKIEYQRDPHQNANAAEVEGIP